MQTPTLLPTTWLPAAGRGESLREAKGGLKASGLDTELAEPPAGMCPVGIEKRLSSPGCWWALANPKVFSEHTSQIDRGLGGGIQFRDSWDSPPHHMGL